MTEPQVDKSHYSFDKYSFEGRFISYYHQLREVLRHHPSSVLEIGVGDSVFGSFLTHNTGVRYESVDVAEDLKPDTVANVTDLPFPDESFDIVCAFEVLEHLPFEEFDQALKEMSRVAQRYIAISVPHFGPMLSFSIKIPFLPLFRLALKLPYPKRHIFNGQHYWEIGKRGYPVSLIRKKLAQHGRIVADFVPWGSEYHHFFVLEVSAHRE